MGVEVMDEWLNAFEGGRPGNVVHGMRGGTPAEVTLWETRKQFVERAANVCGVHPGHLAGEQTADRHAGSEAVIGGTTPSRINVMSIRSPDAVAPICGCPPGEPRRQ